MQHGLLSAALLTVALIGGCESAPKTKAEQRAAEREQAQQEARLQESAAAVLDRVKRENSNLEAYFDESAGYVVFPKVTKGAFIAGGMHGRGVVYERRRIRSDKVIGTAELTAGTLGLQIGGQTFIEIIFFEDDLALDNFKQGNLEISAAASATIGRAGATAAAEYDNGVAVFICGESGLILEASIGAQKFDFEPAS